MNPKRIKLLVTLVLLILAGINVGMSVPADARGFIDASDRFAPARPPVDLASGDPDAGQGQKPPPPPNPMRMRPSGGGVVRGDAWHGWIPWTGRIWATLITRAAR